VSPALVNVTVEKPVFVVGVRTPEPPSTSCTMVSRCPSTPFANVSAFAAPVDVNLTKLVVIGIAPAPLRVVELVVTAPAKVAAPVVLNAPAVIVTVFVVPKVCVPVPGNVTSRVFVVATRNEFPVPLENPIRVDGEPPEPFTNTLRYPPVLEFNICNVVFAVLDELSVSGWFPPEMKEAEEAVIAPPNTLAAPA
jgi:hypothetical protein